MEPVGDLDAQNAAFSIAPVLAPAGTRIWYEITLRIGLAPVG
jgi:hypothetical protein